MDEIIISTIAHKHQRYPTVGDYFAVEVRGAPLQTILVSDMGNEDYEFLVALHELVELWLCKKRGISEESITAFDKQYEAERAAGQHGDMDEPGDDPRAPYRKEHFFATTIERAMAHELGVDWAAYDKAVGEM